MVETDLVSIYDSETYLYYHDYTKHLHLSIKKCSLMDLQDLYALIAMGHKMLASSFIVLVKSLPVTTLIFQTTY